MTADHDPGDEHRERGYKLHRIWPARNESFGHGPSDAKLLGVIVECDGCKEHA